jgi:DNA-directed RNA polymerase alpha subunit
MSKTIWDMPLFLVDMNKRTRTALLSAGVQTLGDLNSMSKNDLLRLPGFGSQSYRDVCELFHELKIHVVYEGNEKHWGAK